MKVTPHTLLAPLVRVSAHGKDRSQNHAILAARNNCPRGRKFWADDSNLLSD